MQSFNNFDPLSLKLNDGLDKTVAVNAAKREIENILDSYVGWYDPFCELIQNSLDAVESQKEKSGAIYSPKIWITINLKENSITVTDNGTGLNEKEFTQFLSPDVSFKGRNKRGHKGVGATYLAYGFNDLTVRTKTANFRTCGKIEGAKNWLKLDNPSSNPMVMLDKSTSQDPFFDAVESGVSIQIKFDKDTHPRDLKWIKASKAKQWAALLSAKTGLGAVKSPLDIKATIKVISDDGKEDIIELEEIKYEFLYERLKLKSASFKEIEEKSKALHTTKGANYSLPPKYTNLDFIYETWQANELKELLKLDEEEIEICDLFSPIVSVEFAYSSKLWANYNSKLGIRANQSVLSPGIQIAANNMPQGEVIQIPLVRYTGRQNQVHFLIHFENCSADMGRKGFKKNITDFSKEISKRITESILPKYRSSLKPATGAAPDLIRQNKLEDWKRKIENHEAESPLTLVSEHFFLPQKQISITSTPTREQDVIALFNQLIAGGVIRGIKIMSTNEMFTYDGMYRVSFEPPTEIHIFDKIRNPLGVDADVVTEVLSSGQKFYPNILEYKYSLDGLIEDFETNSKNESDVNLAVVWETGEDYKNAYSITSLLIEDNLSMRQFHGVTHQLKNGETGGHSMELIVLSELISYLNNPEEELKEQLKKYEEYG